MKIQTGVNKRGFFIKENTRVHHMWTDMGNKEDVSAPPNLRLAISSTQIRLPYKT
jgi:hypothetical protein